MAQTILERVQAILTREDMDDQTRLGSALHFLAKYRSTLLANALARANGGVVRSGPFLGMKLPAGGLTEGAFAPRLLGCYEQELHPILQRIAASGYQTIVNVGCADGYYAVGLALLMPDASVYACDIVEGAQLACKRVAIENGVGERITVGGRFAPADFERFAGRKVLVVCDIEGDELALLDPEQAPALRRFDMLVETHDVFRASTLTQLRERFAPSHEVEVIEALGARDHSVYPELRRLSHLEQLLAVWEWRAGPTPWLFMTARHGGRPVPGAFTSC